MTENTDENLPSAVLTPTQREVLRGEGEDDRTDAQRRAIMARIRDRINATMTADFPLLATELDGRAVADMIDADRALLEKEYPGVTKGTTHAEETLTFPYVIQFLLKIYFSTRSNPIPSGATIASFEGDIEHGVELYLNENNLAGDVDVSISVDNIRDTETLLDDLRDRDEPLDRHERVEAINRLSRAGYSTEEIADVVGGPDTDNDSEET